MLNLQTDPRPGANCELYGSNKGVLIKVCWIMHALNKGKLDEVHRQTDR